MPFSLMIDILVAILLVVTIAYAIVLNKRLGMLRRDKDELEKVALTFGDATRRAEESIARLKSTAGGLEDDITRAQSLRDDLAFLTERGGTAADRLEDLVREARQKTGVPGPSAAAKAAMPQAAPKQPVEPAGVEPAGMEPTGVEPAGGGAAAPRKPAGDFPEPRSEAERELLKALESAR